MAREHVWIELTDTTPQAERFAVLSEMLAAAGHANRFESHIISPEELAGRIEDAKANRVCGLRLGGTLPEVALQNFENLPSIMLSLKCADAVIDGKDGRYWPRSVLHEGFSRMIAVDLKDLDIAGGAFIVGATCEARACIAALVKTGFRRVIVTDTDESKGQALIDDLKRSYFNVQFQFTHRTQVTQLPGVHSVAVNTVDIESDPTHLTELFYFNFLKAGGVWVEVALGSESSALLQEAKSVGAQVEPADRLAAHCEEVFTEFCFGTTLDVGQFRDELARRLAVSPRS